MIALYLYIHIEYKANLVKVVAEVRWENQSRVDLGVGKMFTFILKQLSL